jgi:UDP-2-acetamido-2-deoxy-ribo-hexuluronate aminotransferase
VNAPSQIAIPFVDLKAQYAALRESIDSRIRTVLEHGQYIMGPEVYELEAKLASYTSVRHCITCASGTEALLIALLALDLKLGDEVITTPFTFVATAEMIVLIGGVPVFVDVEEETCNINAAKIESAITSRTRAIMPVSLYGQPCDMDEINAIAARHGLAVIEDAAQSFGAMYKGHMSCNLSTIGCTSFFPSKPLGCYGDGGALFTNDDATAQAMREIRTHGQLKRYYHTRIGVGGRMDTLQCAVVLAKLERFAWELEQRYKIARRYDDLLSDVPGIMPVRVRPDRTCVYAQYTVLARDRARVVDRLKTRGIPSAVHYPIPLNRQPAYAQFAPCGPRTPVAETVAAQVVSLPMHADLPLSVQDEIVVGVRDSMT